MMLKKILGHLQKLLKIQVKKNLKSKSGTEAINDMEDVVVDDKVNYVRRKSSLANNELKADLDMITKRITVAETMSAGDSNSQGFKEKLHELQEASER